MAELGLLGFSLVITKTIINLDGKPLEGWQIVEDLTYDVGDSRRTKVFSSWEVLSKYVQQEYGEFKPRDHLS